jgi:hypothetical protein
VEKYTASGAAVPWLSLPEWYRVRYGTADGLRPRCVSELAAVKGHEKWRVVHDLTYVNEFCEHEHFHMESIKDLLESLLPGYSLYRMDMADAYHHIGMHRGHWTYLGFRWQGVDYVFTIVPFGLCSAPRLFHTFVRPLVRHLREHGLRFVTFLDDFFFGTPSERASRENAWVQQWFAALGLRLSPKRHKTTPVGQESPQCEGLGFVVKADCNEWSLAPHRVESIRLLAERMSVARVLMYKDVASLAGKLLSGVDILSPTLRLYTHEMFNLLRTVESRRYVGEFVPSAALRFELEFWAAQDLSLVTAPIWDRRDVSFELSTDASQFGWGAVLRALGGRAWRAGGPLPEEIASCLGVSDSSHNSSTVRELSAVASALPALAALWPSDPFVLRLAVDSQAAAGALRKGASRSDVLFPWLVSIFSSLQRFNITLRVQWAPRDLISDADACSRGTLLDSGDLLLSRETFDRVCAWARPLLGDLVVDCFASTENARLDTFYSWWPDLGTSGVDALQLSWPTDRAVYAFPPPPLILRAWRHAIQQGVRAVFIIPRWPSQSWWPILFPTGNPASSRGVGAVIDVLYLSSGSVSRGPRSPSLPLTSSGWLAVAMGPRV